MSPKEEWERDIADARKRWTESKETNDYEVYAIACAAYLSSEAFASSDEHWFCGDKNIRQFAISSLIMFSFTLSDNPDDPATARYKTYESRFAKMLSTCRNCAIEYECCDSDLVAELGNEVGIQESRLATFLQELHRKDRVRLTNAMQSKHYSVPNLTESLWSFACMTSKVFLTHTLEEKLLADGSALVGIGVCPGLLLLGFVSNSQLRRLALRQVYGAKNVERYAQMWSRQPVKFRKMFSTGVRRNFKAQQHADMAWYTASFYLKTFSKSVEVCDDIVRECVNCLQVSGLGLPKFGAHALVFELMKINAAKNNKYFSGDVVESMLNYVMSFKSLRYGVVDASSPGPAQESESYKKLSAGIITEWFKLYLGANPSTDALLPKLEFLLQLGEDAFASPIEYDYAGRTALKAATINCSERIVTLVLDTYGVRTAQSFADARSDWISRLWKYQLRNDRVWLPFWDALLNIPNFASKSLSSKRHSGLVVGILQSSRDVAIKFQLPKKGHEVKPPSNSQDDLDQSKCEAFVTSLLETLCETADLDQLLPVLLDTHVLRSILLLSVSGNRGLSLAAIEFAKQATDTDSRESLLQYLVKDSTELTITALIWILTEAAPASSSWLAAMPGLLRISLEALDQVYSPHDGVDTTGNVAMLRLLYQFWEQSWNLVANVIKNIRTWAKDFAVSHIRSVLVAVLEFSEGLLSKFRLLDADLGSGLAGDENWSANLAGSAISCINQMGDMLQLAIPELLSMAVSIIIEILGLIRSFKVTIPDTLMSLLESLATKRLNSRLTKEQLRDLLGAANLPDNEIDNLIENRGRKVSQTSLSPGAANSPSSGFRSSLQQQMSIGDFFKTSGGQRPPVPARPIVNNQVVPQSQHKPSALTMIKAQLSQQQHDSRSNTSSRPGQLAPGRFGVIHPGRPAGYNPPKEANKSDTSSDDDGDDNLAEDGESALSSLGAKQKREDALNKLREAYQQNKLRPGMSQREIPQSVNENSGLHQRRLQMQNEEREKSMMKKRLSAQPTELHRTVLTWDYYGNSPPFKALSEIPDRFEDVKQYQDVMTPLLYLEAWEQIQNAKEEHEKAKVKPFLVSFGKQVKVDGFTDVYVSVTKEAFAAVSLGEGDLLFLTYDKETRGEPVTGDKNLPHCFARIVEGSIKRYNNSAKGHYVDFQIRLNEPKKILSSLSSGTSVSGITLGNMRTVEREFTTLMALPYYNLLGQILKAQPTVVQSDLDQISRLQRTMSLNPSQANAVSKALLSEGFSLIQGPPGTGKTKTILSIIGAMFTTSSLVSQTTGQTTSSKKILVCAPSNAAVDEIVLRLKQGVLDATGEHRNLSILRLGRLEMISEQVRDVTLDELVSKDMKGSAEPADTQLRKDHTLLVAERNQIREQLKNTEDGGMTADQVQELSDRLKDLGRVIREKNYALDLQRDRIEQAKKSRDLQFRQRQNDVLQKAQVVCTTLSASAHPLLASLGVTFDTVIIDEAAQSIELSSLIPLKYGCQKCIMVGDPNQLPPTVISREASRLKYEQSLLVRMFNQHKEMEDTISMLDTQFRMHPEIALFPAAEFYSGKLKNGEGLAERLERPWHEAHRALGPYAFFEVSGEHQRGGSKSLVNKAEATAAIDLVNYVNDTFSDIGSVGVISPYREQVRLMRQMFTASQNLEPGREGFTVDFNSIDGFQGQEKDIIIMSCVRASDAKTNHIGFLSDVRRMNVALTRAKTSLWVLGHSRSLAVNPIWAKLIENAQNRGLLVPAHSINIVDAIEAFDARPPRIAHMDSAGQKRQLENYPPSSSNKQVALDRGTEEDSWQRKQDSQQFTETSHSQQLQQSSKQPQQSSKQPQQSSRQFTETSYSPANHRSVTSEDSSTSMRAHTNRPGGAGFMRAGDNGNGQTRHDGRPPLNKMAKHRVRPKKKPGNGSVFINPRKKHDRGKRP